MSGPADFAHLHVASAYSMRYGVASPAALAARASELGMPALALTDRDGLYGAVKHATACYEAEISPILGVDLALRAAPGAPGSPDTPGGPGTPDRPGGPGAPGTPGGPGARRPPWAAGESEPRP